MTGPHPSDALLNDWAEDLLPDVRRRSVDDHLAACEPCRHRAGRLRALLADLAALPREARPGADLRPGIRARLSRRAAWRSLRAVRRPLAVAAALLVVGTATLTAFAVRALDDDGAPARPASTTLASPENPAVAELRALERDYARAAEDLLAALERSRRELPPETVRLVEESLGTVERALEESRTALAEDPASPVLRELVLAAHRHKLDVLRRATELAAGT